MFLYGYTPQAGDTIVDVGAGIGEEIRTFSRLVGPNGRAIAAEAHPRAAEILRRNVRRWRLVNVTVIEVAVAGEGGVLRLSDDGASVGNRLSSGAGVPVRAVTLDELFEEADVETVDFLKMNIEGSERAALGASTRLNDVTSVAVSCHDFLVEHGADPVTVATTKDVEVILRTAGFRLTSRPEDERSWVRYYLYGSRNEAEPRRV